MTRKLVTGEEAKELAQPTELLIHTKCPSKWLLIDMETGEAYRGAPVPFINHMWDRSEDIKFQIVPKTKEKND